MKLKSRGANQQKSCEAALSLENFELEIFALVK